MSRRTPVVVASLLAFAALLAFAFLAGRAYERFVAGGGLDALVAAFGDGYGRADAPGRTRAPTAAAAARDRDTTRARLAARLDVLAPQRPGHPDLFVLGIAGDGSEQVFLNEVEHLRELAERRLDARGRVVVLANHDVPPPAAAAVPATRASIRAALAGIGAAMDREQDILLLYATTHGTDEHRLLLRRDGWPDGLLDAKQLRRALDDAGIRHRVVVLSACYSGGLAPALVTPDTLFLSAARADRTSFGCGDDSVATFFGRAWLVDGLNSTVDFAEAFRRARAAIAMREAAGDYPASQPQIREGESIGATLAAWRAAFAPGAPVPYPFGEPGFDAAAGAEASDPSAPAVSPAASSTRR